MSDWRVDIEAANRADALAQIRRTPLPYEAGCYLEDLVVGEGGYYVQRFTRDRPFLLRASGTHVDPSAWGSDMRPFSFLHSGRIIYVH